MPTYNPLNFYDPNIPQGRTDLDRTPRGRRYRTYKKNVNLGPNQHLAFEKGKGYYAAAGKPRAGRGGGGGGGGGGPLDIQAYINNYFRNAMLTPEQQRAEARRQVNTAINDQLRDFRRERAEGREANLSQQLTAEGLALALAGSRSADAEKINAAWQAAQGDMTSFANALTGTVQGAQQAALAAGVEEATKRGGGSQVIAPSPEANQQVSNFVGGTLPAATAARRAEAEYQSAVERGDAQAARFWDQQRAIEFEGRRQEGDYNRALVDIERERPKLLREAEQGQQERARQELATLMSVLTAQAGLQDTQSQIDERLADLGIKKGTLAAKNEANRIREEANKRNAEITRQRNAAWARDAKRRADIAAMNADTARGKALGVDPDTGMPLPGYKFDKNGNVIKDPAQQKKAQQSATMETGFRGDVTKFFQDTYVNKTTGAPTSMPPTKAALVATIMQRYGNALIGHGVSAAGVRAWATQVLNSFPKAWWNPQFYKPRGGTTTEPGSSSDRVVAP